MIRAHPRSIPNLVGAALVLVSVALAGGCAASGRTSSISASSAQSGDIVPGARDGDIRVVRELPAPQGTMGGAEQPVAVNDVLEVDVFQVDELDRTVQVDSRGIIALPLVGEVAAAGKPVRELENEIKRLYGASYLQSPQISVFVKESFGQRVTVDGEVRKAGIYATSATSSLISVLAQAGGLSDIADASKVYVFRDFGKERLVANYDAAAIRGGRRPDPKIYGGDVVVVFASSSKVAMRNLREVLGLARNAAVFVPL
jgi:polysaccharide export outer membrane protein